MASLIQLASEMKKVQKSIFLKLVHLALMIHRYRIETAVKSVKFSPLTNHAKTKAPGFTVFDLSLDGYFYFFRQM